MNAFAKHLAQARSQLNLSQTELAAKIGVDRSSVCRWENGSRSPSRKQIVKLAEVLGCKAIELESMLYEEDEGRE